MSSVITLVRKTSLINLGIRPSATIHQRHTDTHTRTHTHTHTYSHKTPRSARKVRSNHLERSHRQLPGKTWSLWRTAEQPSPSSQRAASSSVYRSRANPRAPWRHCSIPERWRSRMWCSDALSCGRRARCGWWSRGPPHSGPWTARRRSTRVSVVT